MKAKAKVLKPSDEELRRRIARQQRAIAAGKRGYRVSDELTDELVEHMRGGRTVPMGNGRAARLRDKFADATRVGYGGAVRRYEIEIVEAADVKL